MNPAPRPAIVGIAGPDLSPAEAALFRAFPPAGVILFARNIQDPTQLRALTTALRAALPPNAEILVDQEGGRVARLRPPHWHAQPAAATIGALFATNPAAGLRAAFLTGALIGLDCRDAGITVAAAPVLDISVPGAHDVIGDRAYAQHPVDVARLGGAVANGLFAAGVLPIGKHAPGHGRAHVDSHLSLPVVDEDIAQDIRTFALNAALPWLMTAHIVYKSLDPHIPGTLSPSVIRDTIRGRIGFNGVLVTDDLAMNALSGTPADKATRALAAGCDLALYCPGDPAANEAVLRACPPMPDVTARRLQAARGQNRRLTLNAARVAAERDRLLA